MKRASRVLPPIVLAITEGVAREHSLEDGDGLVCPVVTPVGEARLCVRVRVVSVPRLRELWLAEGAGDPATACRGVE